MARQRLVGRDAGAHLDADPAVRDWPSRAHALAEQARVVVVLEREYGSGVRLVAGAASILLLTFGITAFGLSVALVVSDEVAATAGEALLLTGVGAVLAMVFAVPGWRLGRATVRAGRRVVDALVRWHRLPEAVPPDDSDVAPEHRRSGDAVESGERRWIARKETALAHTYAYRGPLLVRIAVGSLLAVAAILGWGVSAAALVRAESVAEFVIGVALAGTATVVTAAVAYTVGGAYRVNAAHARRDPRAQAIRQGVRRWFRRIR